jgi:hydrogenase nickel incorporation protein HypA/HybF
VHELSLSSGIVEVVLRHAAGRRVTAVSLRVGGLRQVVPDSLEFYFGICARGTVCEDAVLEQEIVPARLRCEACSTEWEPALLLFVCADCGGREVKAVAGEELEIESIVVEEADVCTASR